MDFFHPRSLFRWVYGRLLMMNGILWEILVRKSWSNPPEKDPGKSDAGGVPTDLGFPFLVFISTYFNYTMGLKRNMNMVIDKCSDESRLDSFCLGRQHQEKCLSGKTRWHKLYVSLRLFLRWTCYDDSTIVVAFLSHQLLASCRSTASFSWTLS